MFGYWGMRTVTLTACQMPSAARYATLIQSENVPHSAWRHFGSSAMPHVPGIHVKTNTNGETKPEKVSHHALLGLGLG